MLPPIAVPEGATDSTMPANERSGIASSEIIVGCAGTILAASTSWNGAATWNVATFVRTRNCVPPGRIGNGDDADHDRGIASLPLEQIEGASA